MPLPPPPRRPSSSASSVVTSASRNPEPRVREWLNQTPDPSREFSDDDYTDDDTLSGLKGTSHFFSSRDGGLGPIRGTGTRAAERLGESTAPLDCGDEDHTAGYARCGQRFSDPKMQKCMKDCAGHASEWLQSLVERILRTGKDAKWMWVEFPRKRLRSSFQLVEASLQVRVRYESDGAFRGPLSTEEATRTYKTEIEARRYISEHLRGKKPSSVEVLWIQKSPIPPEHSKQPEVVMARFAASKFEESRVGQWVRGDRFTIDNEDTLVGAIAPDRSPGSGTDESAGRYAVKLTVFALNLEDALGEYNNELAEIGVQADFVLGKMRTIQKQLKSLAQTKDAGKAAELAALILSDVERINGDWQASVIGRFTEGLPMPEWFFQRWGRNLGRVGGRLGRGAKVVGTAAAGAAMDALYRMSPEERAAFLSSITAGFWGGSEAGSTCPAGDPSCPGQERLPARLAIGPPPK